MSVEKAHAVEQRLNALLSNGMGVGVSGDTSGATDTPRIQAALDAGKRVLLGPGTFWVNAILEVPASVEFAGLGIDTTKVKAAAASGIAAVVATKGWAGNTNSAALGQVHARDMTIDGNSTAGIGYVSQNFWSYFERLKIINTTGDGLRFDGFCADGTTSITGGVENHVNDCQFRTCGGIALRATTGSGTNFTDGYAQNNIIQSPGGSAGIFIRKAAGWKIDGNHLYGSPQSAIVCGEAYETLVVNNYIETWGSGAASHFCNAIDFTTNPMADGGHGSVIANNRIILAAAPGNAASTIRGIDCRSATGFTSHVIIVGNQLYCVPTTGAASYDGIVRECQAAGTVLNVVQDVNQVIGWGNLTLNVPNGGTINVTAGI